MIGRVASDLRVAQTVLNHVADANLQFLEDGALNAYGVGGSLMLDWEHYREHYQIDLELRATDIYIRSFGGSSAAVQGSANVQQFSLWARWRAPTGLSALDRPVRYVLETAYSPSLRRQRRRAWLQRSDIPRRGASNWTAAAIRSSSRARARWCATCSAITYTACRSAWPSASNARDSARAALAAPLRGCVRHPIRVHHLTTGGNTIQRHVLPCARPHDAWQCCRHEPYCFAFLRSILHPGFSLKDAVAKPSRVAFELRIDVRAQHNNRLTLVRADTPVQPISLPP